MPYRSRMKARNMGRRYRRRRRRPRRRYMSRAMISRPELKFHQTALANVVMSISATQLPNLNASNIVQGDAATQRIGNFATPITSHGTILVRGFDNAVLQTYRVRLFWFIWKDTFETATHPDLDDLLGAPTDPWSPFKVSARGTFKVLWSRKFTIVNSIENPTFTRSFNYKLPMRRLQRFTWDGATQVRNHLFFYAISEFTVDEEPKVSLTNILRYNG